MTPASDEQDSADMGRLVAAQDAALNALMDRHGERLFNYLLRCLQNEDDAADLAQETFVRVYQNRARYNSKQSFSTWLYAIATNLVRDRYRWRSRHPAVSLDDSPDGSGTDFRECLQDPASNPGDTMQSEERAKAVRRALAALPEDLRTPLILAEFEEKSQAEIASILDCTVKAVETRIYRARQQLRGSLGAVIQQF